MEPGSSGPRMNSRNSPVSCSPTARVTSPRNPSPSTAAFLALTHHDRMTMSLKYYHAEPVANSLKSMIPLIEKGLAFESVYVDLHKFVQHSGWLVGVNREGQVPVLDHDGNIITHTTVINEYLEDVFPDVPLRPRNPVGAARMRYWNKFVDEHVMNHVSTHRWHRM